MDARTVSQVKSWDSRPFSAGFRGLHDLSDAEFSGVVHDGGAWLFMLNGRVVGVFDGELADFENAEGTAFEAPHPSLPLLFTMQERGGNTQAKYYTNDTPLAEASETLAGKNFTGYVELSENVLSGDYYVVYHGGRSMSVAYVGESEQLLTGDEAFERANDEVGIYEVVAADVDVAEIPEPETDDAAASPPVDAGDGAGPSGPSAPEKTEPPAGEPTSSASPSPESSRTESGSGPPPTEPAGAESGGTEGTAETTASGPESRPERSADRPADRSGRSASGEGADEAGGTAGGDPLTDEQEWRETTSIPSLDPERSTKRARTSRPQGPRHGGQPQRARRPNGQPGTRAGTSERANELESELEARAEKISALQGALSAAETERDDLREERDALKREVEQLRQQLDSAGGETGSGGGAGRTLTRQRALAGTNLFVRYGSKGRGTLADAAAGEAEPDEVESNLKLEHHTGFESDGVTVDGRPFDEFLHDSMEYRFVSWLITDLLYEILETGHQRGLKDLYEAIPDADRIELRGTVEADDDEGETYEETFDVVVRDRMGNPLVAANINDSRDPATGEMLGSLVESASNVAAANEDLCAAFQVTRSFFEPAALETTEDATSGGLLTREKRESFVKLSRKRGYHLCLVESRDGEFHLTVPEL